MLLTLNLKKQVLILTLMTPGLMSMIEEMTNKKVSFSNIHCVPKKYKFSRNSKFVRFIISKAILQRERLNKG
jgi:hypothetical protein